MIDPQQLTTYIIDPVLKSLGLHSQVAVNLLLGTAAQESHMGTYIAQIKGPARSIYQIEKPTHDDIWSNFLGYKPELAGKVKAWCIGSPDADELYGNLYYATAMTRVHYYRVKSALPTDPNDIAGLASYWKQHYNTSLGKGTPEEFIRNYNKYVRRG